MTARRRLSPQRRRDQLLEVGAERFARQPYDEVRMDEIAERAGVSRALLYRYFPGKRDLLAAIYRRAAADLVARTAVEPAASFEDLVYAGLDAHIDYFEANRHTVLAANRTLAGDPTIRTIIDGELAELRNRLLEASGMDGHARALASAALLGWLAFVRVLCLEWLEHGRLTRQEVRAVCLETLRGALAGCG